MRQVQISRAVVLDAPRHARGFFEALIADNLEIGGPRTSARSALGAGYAVTLRSACRTAGPRAGRRTQISLFWQVHEAEVLVVPGTCRRDLGSRPSAQLGTGGEPLRRHPPPVLSFSRPTRERGLPFELGRLLLVLGTAQRKARQRRAAAATLDEAIAVFGGLGAARWQALAAAQRARLTPGTDSTLTPAEQRIADLVTAGHSNPEIAAALYISVKTVEANLTRIYRKLALRGRVDLARRSLG